MERGDLYQDDLTEERYPSPARREDAASDALDPDVLPGDDEDDDDEDDGEEDEDDEDDDD